jgi:antitoxin component YwqK of YwqJK toxin-antitoxin module
LEFKKNKLKKKKGDNIEKYFEKQLHIKIININGKQLNEKKYPSGFEPIDLTWIN